MRKPLEEIIEFLKSTRTRDELQGAVTAIREVYDVDHIVYHSVSRSGEHFAALTYTPEWVDRYLQEDYVRIDPVVQGCYQRFHPVNWSELDWSRPKVREFRGEASDAGVGNQGLSMPIRGPNGQFALFTVSGRATDDQWSQYCETHVNDIILIAHFVNQKALDLDNSDHVDRMASLSMREVDTMTLLAMGYSRAQAADKLRISEHTLRVYIDSARSKLGSQNTTHAVAQAISAGLIMV